jgi:hypothetical protein
VPEGEPCPYCTHLAPNPEEIRLHLLHLHPEVEPGPDLVGSRRRATAAAALVSSTWPDDR